MLGEGEHCEGEQLCNLSWQVLNCDCGPLDTNVTSELSGGHPGRRPRENLSSSQTYGSFAKQGDPDIDSRIPSPC